MAVLRSLLAMYGAFGPSSHSNARSRKCARWLKRLLPGTTGPGQRGWYKEIQDFVRRNAPTQSVEFPSAHDAMRELTGGEGFEGVPAQLSSPRRRETFPGDPQPVWASSRKVSLLDRPRFRCWSRSTWGCLTRCSRWPPPRWGYAPHPSLRHPNLHPPGITTSQIPEMLDIFREQGLDGWKPFIEAAAEGDQVAHDVAAIPPMKAIGSTIGPEIRTQITDENGAPREVTDQGKVTSEVIEVNDILAVLLTTEFTRTPWEISKVTGIIDPLNWDNANKFFAEMTPTGTGADGRSSQVLEEVSTDPALYRIATHLKYIKEERPDNNFVIDYDFADSRGRDDSRQVHVDSGYIVISPTADGNGVRVLTSKMVAMDGLSPTAVAIFAHAMGWLSIGEMMMFGDPVRSVDDPIIPWIKSPDPDYCSPGRQTGRADDRSRGAAKGAATGVADLREGNDQSRRRVRQCRHQGNRGHRGQMDQGRPFRAGHDRPHHKVQRELFSEPFRILDTMMKNAAGRAPGGAPGDQAGRRFAMTDQVTSKPVLMANYLSRLWVRMIVRNGTAAETALRRMRRATMDSTDISKPSPSWSTAIFSTAWSWPKASWQEGPGFKVASNVVRSVSLPRSLP